MTINCSTTGTYLTCLGIGRWFLTAKAPTDATKSSDKYPAWKVHKRAITIMGLMIMTRRALEEDDVAETKGARLVSERMKK